MNMGEQWVDDIKNRISKMEKKLANKHMYIASATNCYNEFGGIVSRVESCLRQERYQLIGYRIKTEVERPINAGSYNKVQFEPIKGINVKKIEQINMTSTQVQNRISETRRILEKELNEAKIKFATEWNLEKEKIQNIRSRG